MATIVTRAGKGSALTHAEVDANFVNLNNAKLEGTVPVSSGGTGATDASAARTNLGVAIGTNVQAYNSNLDAFSAKTAPSGAVVGTTDSQSLTNKTLGTGTAITAGTINNASIGATTPAAGTFTTLFSTGNTTLGDAAVDTVTINGTVQPGVVVSGSSSSDALRITQTGTGNALVVEDSTNPDSTPFVIDQSGYIISGATVTESIGSSSVNPPRVFIRGTSGGAGSDIALLNTSSSGSIAGDIRHAKAPSGGIVANNNQLGNSRYFGYDGANYVEAATIGAFVDGTPGTNDMPGRLVFSTTADGASSPTEAMRITSTQRVTVQKASNGAITALADGTTITPDFSAANNFSVTLGGNRTLANPTNLTAGQSGAIVITQDATGSRTLAYGSNWKFPNGSAPTLTTTANAVDVLVYYVESATRITARLIGDVR